jgi:ribosomal-protein-alanine N-acetyltransferase
MSASAGAIECRLLSLKWKQPLLVFLRVLGENNETRFFHPHAFSAEAVDQIIQTTRNDLYYLLSAGNEVLGYGLLRGWDEGYDVPSLGIAIHPRIRGVGLGRMFMHFLHAAAKRHGATKVRLKVSPQNVRAVALYESFGYAFGYAFGSEEHGYLVGLLELAGLRSQVQAGSSTA